jgi:predicted transcriptional regulator
MTLQNQTVLSAVAVATSTTNDPVSVKMDDGLNEIIVYVVNKGASTNLTVTVYSSPDGTIKSAIQPFTLSTTVTTGHVPITVVPQYLVFVAVNGDASNATTYDVIVSKRA